MLLKTLAIFMALTLSTHASVGSSSSEPQEDLSPFEELNLAIKHHQEAIDEDGKSLHKEPAELSLEWAYRSSLSPSVPQCFTHVVCLSLGNFLTRIPEEISLMENLIDLRLSVAT